MRASPRTTPGKTSGKRPSKSKRAALSALARLERARGKTVPGFDWRSALWHQVVHPDANLDLGTRMMIALLMITGCRPAEVLHPEGLRLYANHAGTLPLLAIGLNGAKVTRRASLIPPDAAPFKPVLGEPEAVDRHLTGQPRRKLVVACRTAEAAWLHQRLLGDLDPSRIRQWALSSGSSAGGYLLTPARDHAPLAGRRHPDLASLDKRLARIGRSAFPRLETRITPYLFRHALAAGAKAAGMDRGELAKLLGHASTRTGSAYGAARQSRARPCQRAAQVLRIEADREPRLTHSAGPRSRTADQPSHPG